MKYFEIVLKALFLIGGIYLVYGSKEIWANHFVIFLPFIVVSFVLGIVLIFNKKHSYGYKLSPREIVVRRVEGIILIAFAVACVCYASGSLYLSQFLG